MNAYVYLAAGIIWAASLAGVGWWQNSAGHTAESKAWMDRENKELRAANAEIQRLTDKARSAEAAHAQTIADNSARYQKELANEKARRDRDVAAARAGTLVLRFGSAGINADQGLRPEVGSGACGRDGEPGSGLRRSPGGDLSAAVALPGEITARLYELAHDANDVTRQLAACQRVIIEDRRLCNNDPAAP